MSRHPKRAEDEYRECDGCTACNEWLSNGWLCKDGHLGDKDAELVIEVWKSPVQDYEEPTFYWSDIQREDANAVGPYETHAAALAAGRAALGGKCE